MRDEDIARLPDSHTCYIPGIGEVTLGRIRNARPAPSSEEEEREATFAMWEDIVTRNLCRQPWEPRVPTDAIKTHHAARLRRG